MKRVYTFDDVALVPQYNNIASRTEPDLTTWLTTKIKMGIPLLAANMDTVISDSLANELLKFGSFPIFHRFTDNAKQIEWAKKYCQNNKAALSIGIVDLNVPYDQNIKMRFIENLIIEYGIGVICIDVAHGHSKMMLEQIDWMKRTWPDLQVIAGNVCTAMAYQDLVNAGADAIKVGIGPGAACTTRIVTGFGVSQFSAIRDCAVIAEKLRVPLIADGGIRNSRDVVLALAAGASSVMIGKLFALTEESAAEKRETILLRDNREKVIKIKQDVYEEPEEQKNKNKIIEARYRGQASEDFQNEFYGGLKDKTVAEGTSFWAEVSGPAKNLIEEILGGIRSGMTYGGARTIKELQRKAEFVEVTPTYILESNPRK